VLALTARQLLGGCSQCSLSIALLSLISNILYTLHHTLAIVHAQVLADVPYEGQVLVDLRLDRNIYFLKQRAIRKMIGADSNRHNMSARLMVARELGDVSVTRSTTASNGRLHCVHSVRAAVASAVSSLSECAA
jgi:hypothetical protein